MLSDRIQRIGFSPTLKISAKATAMKAEGIDVIDLSVGEPDFPTPDNIKQAAKRALDMNYTSIPPTTAYFPKVISYIPNILAATLIFGAGYFVAGLVESLVRGALVSVDHEAAKPVSKFARWVLLLVTFFAAVDQLQIAQGLISTFFQGLTYTIVLVLGLSVGLGAKDVVARILNDWYERLRK